MHHLSCSLSSKKKQDVRISLKQIKDFPITKIGHRKQYDRKYNSRYMESPFTSTSNLQSCIIIAIIAGRGKLKHEVGLAVIDLYYPHLTLCQISDCFVYSNTLAKINIYQPDEIIMPEVHMSDNSTEICLQHTIARKFNQVHITTVSSLHFSALVGWDLIQIYCTNESSSVKQIIKHKYYALSAASALLKYTAYVQNMTFAPKTVKVEFQSCNDAIILDIETVELLEIVCSLNDAFPNFTLYNALNKCITPLGKKLLRASLLQPLNNIVYIDKRIQCVLELISNDALLLILQNFEDKVYSEIKELIFEILHIDASSVRGYTSSNMQRCFAIKPKVNELLDIIRQAYCELIDKMIRTYNLNSIIIKICIIKRIKQTFEYFELSTIEYFISFEVFYKIYS